MIYVDLKINKNNELYNFTDENELTRHNLNNEILLKLPFYFDASHVNNKISKDELIYLGKYKKYKKYEKISKFSELFYPNIKSEEINNVYILKKDGVLPIHVNNESINYYFIRDGNSKIVLIH